MGTVGQHEELKTGDRAAMCAPRAILNRDRRNANRPQLDIPFSGYMASAIKADFCYSVISPYFLQVGFFTCSTVYLNVKIV